MVFFFYFIILVPALFVVLLHNPIHAVLALILVFFNLSVLLFCLEVEFLALIFLIVYLGAIAVLFLFVVMMLDVSASGHRSDAFEEAFVAVFFLCFLSIVAYYFKALFSGAGEQWQTEFGFSNQPLFSNGYLYSDYADSFNPLHNIQYLAQVLYEYNFLALFFVAMVLLVAMVGNIALTVFHSSDMRRQLIFKQVERSYSDSIKLEGTIRGSF